MGESHEEEEAPTSGALAAGGLSPRVEQATVIFKRSALLLFVARRASGRPSPSLGCAGPICKDEGCPPGFGFN